jgi:hypothetical protein
MKKELTKKQEEVLVFIKKFVKDKKKIVFSHISYLICSMIVLTPSNSPEVSIEPMMTPRIP